MKKILSKILFIFIAATLCSAAGYKGSLPDIDQQFDYKRKNPEAAKGLYNIDNAQPKEKELKKIPRENKSYIDIILKKDKESSYVNDLNDAILILEKMNKCIESNGSVQKFNAIASSIIDHADYIKEKYEKSPERFYISYAKLQNIAAQARDLATLRCESQVYIKYLLYQQEGQVYSKDSINEQISLFKDELDTTIEILKNSR